MTRVLLVDDGPAILLIAKAALRVAGFDVSVATNGLEALKRVAAAPPDLVLLDWMMSKIDGPGTCGRLKVDPATKDIPVIFLTARSQ